MIIDLIEPKHEYLQFSILKESLSSDEGVNALLDTCADDLKFQVLAHYYGYIAAADRDKDKYIASLVQVFQGKDMGGLVGPVELYVCRHHDWEDTTKLSYSAKLGAEQSYLDKDNS